MCGCDTPIGFSAREVVARKAHQCCECRREIDRGERYQRSEGVWPDGAMSFKTCLRCAELREEGFKAAGHEDGPCCFEGLADWWAQDGVDIRHADA